MSAAPGSHHAEDPVGRIGIAGRIRRPGRRPVKCPCGAVWLSMVAPCRKPCRDEGFQERAKGAA